MLEIWCLDAQLIDGFWCLLAPYFCNQGMAATGLDGTSIQFSCTESTCIVSMYRIDTISLLHASAAVAAARKPFDVHDNCYRALMYYACAWAPLYRCSQLAVLLQSTTNVIHSPIILALALVVSHNIAGRQGRRDLGSPSILSATATVHGSGLSPRADGVRQAMRQQSKNKKRYSLWSMVNA